MVSLELCFWFSGRPAVEPPPHQTRVLDMARPEGRVDMSTPDLRPGSCR